MRHASSLALVGLVVATAGAGVRRADAGARPPPPPRDPTAHVRVSGPAEVADVQVKVDCASRRVLEISATCELRASYRVTATGPVTLSAATLDTIDLGAPGRERALAAGEVATVTITARRAISTSFELPDGPFIVAPMIVRHLYLGESKYRRRTGGSTALALVSGAEVTIGGAPALDADGDGRVAIDLDRDEVELDRASGHSPWGPRPSAGDDSAWVRERRVTVRLSLPARANASGVLHLGGPVLAGGIRGPIDSDEVRFLLRGAYEVSLGEYVFVTAGFETDFDSIIESLVIDAATPEVIVFLPSLRAGTGVLARQLGPRDPDLGVRLRVGGSIAAAGGDVDFDYWPAIDDWTISGTIRVSL